MKRIATVLFVAILLATPGVTQAQQNNLAVPKVADGNTGVGDAPPFVVTTIDTAEYNALVRLAKNKGYTRELKNFREYDFKDSLGYNHNISVMFMPKDLSWDDSAHVRAMQIDVFVSGPSRFIYALSETTGRVVSDCRCPQSTPFDLRHRFDSTIVSALKQMAAKSKEK